MEYRLMEMTVAAVCLRFPGYEATLDVAIERYIAARAAAGNRLSKRSAASLRSQMIALSKTANPKPELQQTCEILRQTIAP